MSNQTPNPKETPMKTPNSKIAKKQNFLIAYFKENPGDLRYVFYALLMILFTVFLTVMIYKVMSNTESHLLLHASYFYLNKTMALINKNLMKMESIGGAARMMKSLTQMAGFKKAHLHFVEAANARSFIPNLDNYLQNYVNVSKCGNKKLALEYLRMTRKILKMNNESLPICSPETVLLLAQKCDNKKVIKKANRLFVESAKKTDQCLTHTINALTVASANDHFDDISEINTLLDFLLESDKFTQDQENTCSIVSNIAKVSDKWDKDTYRYACELYNKNRNCDIYKTLEFDQKCAQFQPDL